MRTACIFRAREPQRKTYARHVHTYPPMISTPARGKRTLVRFASRGGGNPSEEFIRPSAVARLSRDGAARALAPRGTAQRWDATTVSSEEKDGVRSGLDYGALFAQLPTAYLVMDSDLVIVDANGAYEQVLQRRKSDLVGRPVFDAFPPDPQEIGEHGKNPVQGSFERARDTGRMDQMPLTQYNVHDLATGEFQQRYWSLISAPVKDDQGSVVLVIQRVEDVTDYVLERAKMESDRAQTDSWRRRVELVEADLYSRANELRAALRAEEAATRRLRSLAEVALELANTSSVAELVETLTSLGLQALGADGGALAVNNAHEPTLQVAITESLGEKAQLVYSELARDNPLPVALVARTGVAMYLPNEEEGVRQVPEMAQVYADTGRSAWACLPLWAGGRILGSLGVSWKNSQEFPAEEKELLRAFAAQCAHALERLQAREAENKLAQVSRQMSEALQRSLLTDPPVQEHLQIAVRYFPASAQAQVGGDWYDAFTVSPGDTMVVIGDVSGHDQKAAAAMAQIRNVLRGVAQTLQEPPGTMVQALDQALKNLEVDALATAVLGRVSYAGRSPQRGGAEFHWSNAGHLPPLLLHADGRAEFLDPEPNLLLGLDPGAVRDNHTVVLPAGATIILYTDGIVERRDEDIRLGLERLRCSAENKSHLSVEELSDALLETLTGERQEDDAALLTMRVNGHACTTLRGTVHAADPDAVRAARAMVRSCCQEADVDEDTSDNAVLLTSETVTNALIHGHSAARIHVQAQTQLVRVEVGDDSAQTPQVVHPGPDAMGGRGLEIVDMLARQWGVEQEPGGKTVWFEVGPSGPETGDDTATEMPPA